MTETVIDRSTDAAATEPTVGLLVTLFAGTDQQVEGHIVDDFGDRCETETDTHTVQLDRPKRWAVHTSDGLLVFADTVDIEIVESASDS